MKHLYFSIILALCFSACIMQKSAKNERAVLSLKNVDVSAFNPYLVKNDSLQFRLFNTKYYINCIGKKHPNCDTVYLTKNDTIRYIEKSILQDISTEFESGKIYYIVGESGSGKSTLAMGIAGVEPYRITAGEIVFNSKNIGNLSFDQRLKRGIYIALQDYRFLPEDKSISVYDMLKRRYNLVYKKKIADKNFNAIIDSLLIKLELPKEILTAKLEDLIRLQNSEKKLSYLQEQERLRYKYRLEMLQMALLQPKIVILDEFDTYKLLSNKDNSELEKIETPFKYQDKMYERLAEEIEIFNDLRKKGTAFLFITHIYDWKSILPPDKYICLEKGKIIYQGSENVLQKAR